MPLTRSHHKRPGATLAVRLDFTDFAAAAGSEAVTYELRADPGITVHADAPDVGVIDLEVSGGTTGRQYHFGVEARIPSGASEIQNNLLRVREPRDWGTVPVIGPIGDAAPGALYLNGGAILLNNDYVVLS